MTILAETGDGTLSALQYYMRFLPSLIVAAPLLLAASTQVHADTYVGIGIGSDSDISGDIAQHFSTDGATDSSRILLGKRFNSLAIEASVFGTQLHGNSQFTGETDFSTVSLGVDMKYYLGIAAGFEVYGKLGLNKTWLTGPATEGMDYQGRGTEVGGGLQYTLELPLTEVAFWLDYTVQKTELRGAEMEAATSLDGELRMLNLGVSVGF